MLPSLRLGGLPDYQSERKLFLDTFSLEKKYVCRLRISCFTGHTTGKCVGKEGKIVKKIMCILLSLITLAPASACARPVEPDLSAYDTSGRAEIPVEILGELDEELREDLLEAPKYVALTFDDGPRADTTARLLDGLLERGAAATFFVIGEQIPGNEPLLLRMKAEGLRLKSDRKEGDGMERDGYCGHFEWDEPGFEVMRQYILTGGSDLEDALEVFYSAGGYDFFNVVDPRYYGDRWLEFIGNLYSEIDDGKYAPSGKPYKRYAIPLTEEQKRELSSRGVPDVFVTDIP